MADQSIALSGVMASVPPELRSRIVNGMRWTVWLSLLALPFSFGTNVILARISPEAIGTFGLLSVYIGLVAAFFYLGGDPVVIKFIPEVRPEKRLAFLGSYFVIVCVTLCAWLLIALKWPDKLHYLFGDRGGSKFHLLALYLSPLYIFFAMTIATLKALLEIRWAQGLLRTINIGSFLLYATLFLFWRTSISAHYVFWVWGVYLGLTLVLAVVGAYRLIKINASAATEWRFFLPRGFWKYALATQQLSALGFFVGRLDYVLVLNYGSLAVLGQYVAVNAIALLIPLVNTFFMDTLLPSLTNLVARNDYSAAADAIRVYMRISFVVNAATTSALLLSTGVVLRILGPRYDALGVPALLAVLLVGLGNPGAVGSIVLSSVGKQQRAVFVTIGQFVMYCVCFYVLWPHWHLLGAVIAFGLANCLANISLLVVAQRSATMRISAGREYLAYALSMIITASAASLVRGPLDLLAVPLWMAVQILFFLLARYRGQELREFLHCFLPGISFTSAKL